MLWKQFFQKQPEQHSSTHLSVFRYEHISRRRFRLPKGRWNFYGEAGINSCQYKESNPIGEVKKGGLGYTARIGSYVKAYKGLLIDFSVSFSRCKIKPADYTINIGGIEAGIGLGYEF